MAANVEATGHKESIARNHRSNGAKQPIQTLTHQATDCRSDLRKRHNCLPDIYGLFLRVRPSPASLLCISTFLQNFHLSALANGYLPQPA